MSVLGDRRRYLTALIIPAWEELKAWAEGKGVAFTDDEELIRDSRVTVQFAQEIEKHTRDLSRVEKIKRFKVLPPLWSRESGELTPTLKVRRNVVEERYRDLIDEMYPPG
ncbi:MAG: hypothetical protein DRH37_08490 [Deltaproteobacteria bacterium]|nr:MAG: hypothetical protein DRH37_08490 [Deltaproteobacteria bacterium]